MNDAAGRHSVLKVATSYSKQKMQHRRSFYHSSAVEVTALRVASRTDTACTKLGCVQMALQHLQWSHTLQTPINLSVSKFSDITHRDV